MADTQPPILCPFCAQAYAWRFEAGNKRVTCKCGSIFRIPLNAFSACELIARPGQPLPPPADDMAIAEDPVEPHAYLLEVDLTPEPEEPLVTQSEPATPQPTPPAPRKRPQIIPLDEAPPFVEQDRSAPPPAPRPTPRPHAALTDKPPVKNNEQPAREALDKPAPVSLVCPHCQGDLPGNVAADICPHCKSVITPVRQNEVQAEIDKTLDDPLMAVLRKRGMEQVVQTVAREAAERKALNRKHEHERNIYDVWLPAAAAFVSLLIILAVTLLGLRHHPFLYMSAHHFVWLILLSLPACIASMWVGQNVLDADFHLDRILFVKISGIILFPYALGLLFVPGVFDMKNSVAYISLLILVIGGYTLMIGAVYRLTLSQAAIMTGVYAMLMVIFTSTAANQLIKLILWPLP